MSPRTLILAAVLAGGCADKAPVVPVGSALSVHKEATVVTIPLQPARNLWATIRQTARGRIVYAQGKCQRNELSATECAQIAKDIETVRQLDFEITRALDNPTADLDVAKIAQILTVSAKIIGALIP